jgi:hypothetical protein
MDRYYRTEGYRNEVVSCSQILDGADGGCSSSNLPIKKYHNLSIIHVAATLASNH